MEYHVTLARNDVIGELAGARSQCSVDDFNETCTAVIVKKLLARQVFIHFSSHQYSNLAQMIQFKEKIILVRECSKERYLCSF